MNIINNNIIYSSIAYQLLKKKSMKDLQNRYNKNYKVFFRQITEINKENCHVHRWKVMFTWTRFRMAVTHEFLTAHPMTLSWYQPWWKYLHYVN